MAKITQTDEDLNLLEKDIRQLRIEYDSYFAGGRPRPPSEIEWRVNNIIKKYSATRLSHAHRFRFDGLVSRYAKFSELWRQRTRQKEAGLSPYIAAGLAAREATQAELGKMPEHAAHTARAPDHQEIRMSFSDPMREPEKVQQLYRTLVEARQQAGEKADVNFEQFHRFVRQKTDELKKKLGCQQVEYSVSVEHGQVKLKAKGK